MVKVYREFVKYIIAFLIYNDGILMAINFTAIFGAVVGLFVVESVTHFYIIGGVAGLALSSVQAVSRAMVGALSPPGRSAEFYGFFAVAGRTSSFIGPTIYGIVAAEAALFFEAQGNQASFLWFRFLPGGAPFVEQLGQRVAILPVILFLLVGLVLLLGVNEKDARNQFIEPTS